MTRVGRETGLVTQMGNTGHASEGVRLTREWLEAGAIGPVREIHCWTDRPGKWWTQNLDRPAETPPVPATLDWDLWIGAAPVRPYSKLYHPFAWRGWFDFGTGALGDMAIHNMDPAFYSLDLGAPGRRSQDERTQTGIVSALVGASVRIRRERRSAGGDAHLVRWRQETGETARHAAERVALRQRHLLCRRQGHTRR